MTRSTHAAPAPGNWTPRPARALPTLAAVLLLGGSAVAAPRIADKSDTPGAPLTAAQLRGTDQPGPASSQPYALAGRSRFETRFGVSNLSLNHDRWIDALDVAGGDFSLAFVHWAHENVALELSLGATNIGVSSRRTIAGETVHAEGLYRVMAGGRFYLPVTGALRPHVHLAGGLVTEIQVDDSPWQTDVTGRTAEAGLDLGGGVDFILGRRVVFGVRAGTLVRGGHRSQLNLGCSLGWAFGGGR